MTKQNGLERSSATERISAMLDERGKEHRVWPSGLVIWHDEGSWVYEYNPPKGDEDYWGGILHATLRHCTPEQAVEATLGEMRCRDCKYVTDEGYGCKYFSHYEQGASYRWEDVPAEVEPDGFCAWGKRREDA